MLNSLMGRFGGFAGGGGSHYLGTKTITANVAISFPNNVGFAVVKLFGGRGNNGAGGFTAIKLGSSSAGQTYYITNDGNESPAGTWVNGTGSPSPYPPSFSRSYRGGGFVSISTGDMGPGGGSIPTKVGGILGISGGGGSRQIQGGSGAGANAGYPGGGNGGPAYGAPGGIGGNSATPIGGWPVGSALLGLVGTISPPPNSGSGGGGGAGYIGGGSGIGTPTNGGRGGGGGGGSNYYVPSSNPHLSSVANNVFSYPSGYDTNDPDYDAAVLAAPDGPGGAGFVGTTGYTIIKFFSGEELDYDSSNYPSSQSTAPNGF